MRKSSILKSKMPYYAVAKGRSAGVYNSWSDCKDNVNGYSGATYKKFNTQSEAQNFVSSRSDGGSSGGRILWRVFWWVLWWLLRIFGKGRQRKGQLRSWRQFRLSVVSSTNTERIFVDGAARGNGKHACPQSGYGVYYGAGDSRNRAVPLSDVDDVSSVKPTNQRAELHAMNHALSNIQKEHSSNPSSTKSYEIHTDSTYTKNSIDTWADKWKDNGWKTSSGSSVANKDLIQRNHELYTGLKDSGVPVELVHVRGHSGNEGNEQADRLANQGADQMK
ncbi:hypothetical protein OXX59_008584 [Metschnikowia pulcherrima]